MPKIQVRVQLSFPLDMVSQEHKAHLKIKDELSGIVLASFDMTAAQWLELSASSSIEVAATVGDLSRLGKELVVETSQYGRVTEAEAQSEAEVKAHFEHWEEFEVRRSNSGYYAVFKRWEDPI